MNRSFKDLIAGEKKTFVFDLETTGLIQGYRYKPQSGVGISQLALREMGTSNSYARFTDILQEPLTRHDPGKMGSELYEKYIEQVKPGSVHWQKGYKTKGNVLHEVHKRHVVATKEAMAAARPGAIKGATARLATEAELLEKMTQTLEAGHKLRGWNIEFDMLMMSNVAARANPALAKRWTRAMNIARNRLQFEDMGSSVRKISYLAAQESFMSPKFNKETGLTLGQMDPDVRWQAKHGKLSIKDIERLSYDKMIEPHQGFQEYFAQQRARVGPQTYQGHLDWLAARRGERIAGKVQTFATGKNMPDVRYTKAWSADIIASALAPDVTREKMLHAQAAKLLGRERVVAHEALSDTALEEVIDNIFRTDAENWGDAWKDISPRLRMFGIESEQQFMQRMRGGILKKGRSQLLEAAQEATGVVDKNWFSKLTGAKNAAMGDAASDTAAAVGSQPMNLRRIYSGAWQEVSEAATSFGKRHPYAAGAAAALAAFTVADTMAPESKTEMRGVRDSDSNYRTIDGISFGPYGSGSKQALTDFGSGRGLTNQHTQGYGELASYRASLAYRFPDREGVKWSELEKSYQTWTTARSSHMNRMFHRGEYKMAKGGHTGVPGINRGAWVGMLDLKDYNVKVDDADTIALHRKGLMGLFRDPVQVRLAGIDAPEVHHPGMYDGRIEEDQFAGKQAGEYFSELLERQQSLRLLIDPSGRTYNRHVGVLIGDRNTNLNLGLVAAGAASALPWSKKGIVDQQTFAAVEAQAARGGIGMWESKGWQMDRAMGLIAGRRVTHTSLTQLNRITKSAALSGWYGLVQRAHDSKEPWSQQEMQQMYQVGTAYRAEVMGATNQRTREIGHMPGLRRPTNAWQAAGHGINPNTMAHGNVSDFSSGRATLNKAQTASLPNTASAELAGTGKWTAKQYETKAPVNRIVRTEAVASASPEVAVNPETQQRLVARDVYRREADVIRNAAHVRPVPQPIMKATAPVLPTPAVDVRNAVKVVSKSQQPVETAVFKGIKESSARAHAGKGRAGLIMAGSASAGVGTYVLHRDDEETRASQMVGPAARHPNEWVAMRSSADFPGSHKAGAWAEHHAHKNPAMMREERISKLYTFASVFAMTDQFIFPWMRPFGQLQAWQYFYEGRGLAAEGANKFAVAKGKRIAKDSRAMRKVMKESLKDQGFSKAAIKDWFRNQQMQKGFAAKIRPGAGAMSNWLSKVTTQFHGMKEWPDKITQMFKNKQSNFTEKAVSRVKDWMQNLTAKPMARARGLEVNEYLRLKAAGTPMKVVRGATRLGDQAGAFKYLWKHLVSERQGFMAKLSGIAELFQENLGLPFEQMKMAHEMKMMDKIGRKVKAPKNMFTRTGRKIVRYMRHSKYFTEKFPKAAAKLVGTGKAIQKFGMSKMGRVAGRVPIANVVFGLIDGYANMDQYENASKGFAVETAAGIARITVETTMMRPSLWVAAGAKGLAVGSVAGPLGSAIGAVVGFVAAAAINIAAMMIAGELTAGAVRSVGQVALLARKKRAPDPAAYTAPQEFYPEGPAGFQAMRLNNPPQYSNFSGVAPSRPDMSPFGSAYNPIKGQNIDSRTLQMSNNKRRVTARRKAPRPVSMFTPTFGLVNNALWKRRNRSKVRSVVERVGRPARDRNRSRMLARAA